MTQNMSGAVAWKRIGTFYGIALGGAVLVAGLVFLLRSFAGDAGAVLGLVVTAVLYMPLPLVAGLVTERIAGRPTLLAMEWRALRGGFWRRYGRSAVVAVLATLAVVAIGFSVAWLAGVLQLPGAGHLAGDDAELASHLSELGGGAAITVTPMAVLVPVTLLQGILAGLTVNGLFAFGEEYGWRGVLADELRPLGLVRATALTGVLWGFWHAPIIVLGHNYGAEWGWGILVMVTWTVPFSYLLTWTRRRTGSVLAPAILHGAFNGVAGLFTLLVVGGSVLVALPVGVLMALTLTIAAALVWRLPVGQDAVAPSGAADLSHIG